MNHFTPDEQKSAIGRRVEAMLGSLLEDLVVAAWAAYGLTRDKPKSEAHKLCIGVINTFELHTLGWSTSKMIPGRFSFEGKDATLEERITQYCDLARKHEADLRPNFIMMLGCVYLMTGDDPDDMLQKWAVEAMKRHNISPDSFTNKNPLRINFVLPDSDQIH